ncbi:MAG: hemolysin family protein [Actinomycetota bacterium]
MPLIVGLLIVVALVVANGFFVAVEFALVAADRQRLDDLADGGSWSARAAIGARRRLSFHLSGAQLGITVTSLVLGFLSEPIVGRMLEPVLSPVPLLSGTTGSIVVALAATTVFQMLFGELIPKTIAVAKPETVSQALSPLARIVHGALSPLIRVLNGAANATVRLLGMEPQEELADVRSLEELDYLIQTSGESGALTPAAQTLLTRTIRFGGKTAADALTPRVHVAAIEAEASANDLLDLARGRRFSRFPVIGADLDHVVGVVEVTAAFEVGPDERRRRRAGDLMTEPLIVPETRDLVDIVDDFRAADEQMAVVIDEHGGTAGILTLEDVLEEIVGNVDDEYDEATELTVGVAPGVFLLAGTLHPDEVEEACGLVIPDGEYETVAGFVLDRLGRIPTAGDELAHDGWVIEVAEMDRLRIASLQVVRPPDPPDPVGPADGGESDDGERARS